MPLAELRRIVRTGRVEVAQAGSAEIGALRDGVQHVLNNQFGFAVDVNRGFGMLFINKARNRITKDGGGGRKNQLLNVCRLHGTN